MDSRETNMKYRIRHVFTGAETVAISKIEPGSGLTAPDMTVEGAEEALAKYGEFGPGPHRFDPSVLAAAKAARHGR